MSLKILGLLVAGASSYFSCTQITTGKTQQIADSTILSVETKDPNAKYKPAFEGQTRIKAIKSVSKFKFEVLTENLNSPWAIKSLPDGNLIITEKAGNLRLINKEGKLSEKIYGLPKVNDDGQGGLLGLAIHPDFKVNRMIFWVFSENVEGGTLTAVAKGKLSSDNSRIENPVVIYRAYPSHKGNLHYGGRILFDSDNNLIVSTGERSDKSTRPQAQHLDSGLGKIIRIDQEGKPVKGNPFENNQKARPELYSIGHRNVQGLALNPATGELWSNEFGPRGGDEINRVLPGKNYGWPTITYGIEYIGRKIGDAIQQKEGLEQPVYYWDPSISPSGMTFYSGKGIEEWKNNLFVGALSGMHIIRLVIENNKVVGEERLLSDEYQRFRDVHEGLDGYLYAVTDQGRLYKIGK